VKPEWRDELAGYLREVSSDLVRRGVTSLILGCTHFEFFEREFAALMPTLAARNGIVSPSAALAVELFDAFTAHLDAHPVQPIGRTGHGYFAFSGERPPEETFQGLGIGGAVQVDRL